MAFDRASIQAIRLLRTIEMSDDALVSIIIPAYNEAQRLSASITELDAYLRRVTWAFEVLLVVERSPDGTAELAAELARTRPWLRVIARESHRGKGFAVRTGMLQASGAISFFMDADLSTPLREIDEFLERFFQEPELDVLIGNRQHAKSRIVRRQRIIRRTMAQIFNAILREVAGVRLADTQCGFKAFRQAARETIFPLQKLDGFAFDVEVLLLADRLGFKVADMPVEWHNVDGSKVHIIRDSWRMLRDAVDVRRLVRHTLSKMR